MIIPLWTQITRWMQENAPVTFAALAPPVTQEELAELEAVLGYSVPADLVELLRLNNGQAEEAGALTPIPGSLGLAGTRTITHSVELLRRIGKVAPGDSPDGDWDWWSYYWIPIADDFCGGHLVYDVHTGAISRWIEEDGIPSVTWLSLEGMLADMAAGLQGDPPVHLQMKANGQPGELGEPEVIDGELEWLI